MRQDLAYALRGLRRAPGFAVVAVLTLALGIGATTAIFSAINAVLLRSWLPAGHADQLAYVWTPNHKISEAPIEAFGPSNGDFFDLQRQIRSFSSLTLFEQEAVSLETGGGAERVGGAQVLPNFFSTLESAPERGRVISASDVQPGQGNVVVISHALAQSAFGGSAPALGKSLTLDGHAHQVIGVMPADFNFPTSAESPYGAPGIARNDVWLPLALTPQQKADRDNSSGFVMGRLRPNAPVQQAQSEVSAIMPRLDADHTMLHGWYGVVQPFTAAVLGTSLRLMWLLFGAVGAVLLIACANVANLFLARAADRSRELGVRAALGAGRWRMLRQRLAEALLLACLGGALGVAVAEAALRLLLRFNPGGIPRLDQASLDLRALLFTVAISLLTGIAFGLLPALGVSRANLTQILKLEGRGTVGAPRRWRHALIVAEVALAVILLAASSLLVRSYFNLEGVPTGFSSDATLTLNIALDARYNQREQRQTFFRQTLARLAALPGVAAAGAASDLPLNHATTVTTFRVEGQPNRHQLVESHFVTQRYFQAMGIAVLAGRAFTDEDATRYSAAIVDQAFAQAYFPDQSAIGKRLCMCATDGNNVQWLRIVGVVANVRHHSLEDAPPPQVYLLFWQTDLSQANFVLRTAAPPTRLIPAVRSAVRAMDPALAVADVHTMSQLVSAAGAQRRFQATLFAAFAGTALLLAAIGLYGVMAYSVRQRTAEIGVRIALGAGRAQVLKLIVGQGMALAALGIALGVLAALGCTRLFSSLLYGVAATDPATLVRAAAVLAAVSLAACTIPAWQASRVDPLMALRHE